MIEVSRGHTLKDLFASQQQRMFIQVNGSRLYIEETKWHMRYETLGARHNARSNPVSGYILS